MLCISSKVDFITALWYREVHGFCMALQVKFKFVSLKTDPSLAFPLYLPAPASVGPSVTELTLVFSQGCAEFPNSFDDERVSWSGILFLVLPLTLSFVLPSLLPAQCSFAQKT